MSKSDKLFQNFNDYNIKLYPGDIAVFCVDLPSGANGEVNLSVRWGELF